MPDYTAHCVETERRLRELLQRAASRLEARDLSHAWGFLAAGEYGLTLETIADGLTGQHDVGPEIVQLVDKLAASMEDDVANGESVQLFRRSLARA